MAEGKIGINDIPEEKPLDRSEMDGVTGGVSLNFSKTSPLSISTEPVPVRHSISESVVLQTNPFAK